MPPNALLPVCRSVLYSRMSKIPMRCTSEAGKEDVPCSAASCSWRTYACSEPSLGSGGGGPRPGERPGDAVADGGGSSWKRASGWATRARVVRGTREKRPWSRRKAAASRNAASPARTPWLGGASAAPGGGGARGAAAFARYPFGLFGAHGSSSHCVRGAGRRQARGAARDAARGGPRVAWGRLRTGLKRAIREPSAPRMRYVPPIPSACSVGTRPASSPAITAWEWERGEARFACSCDLAPTQHDKGVTGVSITHLKQPAGSLGGSCVSKRRDGRSGWSCGETGPGGRRQARRRRASLLAALRAEHRAAVQLGAGQGGRQRARFGRLLRRPRKKVNWAERLGQRPRYGPHQRVAVDLRQRAGGRASAGSDRWTGRQPRTSTDSRPASVWIKSWRVGRGSTWWRCITSAIGHQRLTFRKAPFH